MKEFAFIRQLTSRLSRKTGMLIRGIGDDCAHIAPAPPDAVQLISIDTLSEGVHFSERYSNRHDIGWRSVAVNLSDLAASGADTDLPMFLFLALAVPQEIRDEDLTEIIEGVADCAETYGAIVAGGDSTMSLSRLTITITAVGYTRNPISREGAKRGDLLAVIGDVGCAGAGFDLLETGKRNADTDGLVACYTRPRPLLSVGTAMSRSGTISAMLDISDGVIADAGHLVEFGALNVFIDIDKLPVPRIARDLLGDDKAFQLAATFGDDYALLCALDPSKLEQAQKLAQENGSAMTVIGRFETGQGQVHPTFNGEPIKYTTSGYQHTIGR